MRKKRNKNPLIKRILRELSGDWKKYLVVALFLILTIGFVSGMYVANGSMLKAAEDGKQSISWRTVILNCRKRRMRSFLQRSGQGRRQM